MSRRIPGPQNAQMLDLDRAIDQVAARLTHVDHDPLFAQRLVASLPERSRWFGWRMGLAAATFGAVVLAVVLTRVPTTVPATVPAMVLTARVQPMVGQPSPVVPIAHVALVGTKPLERMERVEPMELARVDHERALSALAMDSLAIAGVSTETLPDEGSLSVPSLQIADLPLTAESFPQQ